MTKYFCPHCGQYEVVEDDLYRERNRTCGRCYHKHQKKQAKKEKKLQQKQQFRQKKATA